jgi:MiaB-like tRNA modifying enzyme
MSFLISKAGHNITDIPEKAEVIILNTCTVRLETEKRMVDIIKRYLKFNKRLVVAGCLAGAEPGLVKKISPNISMVSPRAVEKIVEVVENDKPTYILLPHPREHLPNFMKGVSYFVPIAEGCRGVCSYCIVRIARGNLRSYPPQTIFKAVKKAVNSGAKEVYLTSQDSASYGLDLGARLPILLRMICGIPSRFMIRVGMMNPNSALEILDELVEVYREKKIYKFLHLPVQSGNDRILGLMRRKYTVKDFNYVVNKFRKAFSDISLMTDIIVGFPTESDDEFKDSCRLIKKLRPDKVNVARFTVRPHTPASAMPQVSEGIKKQRSRLLSKLVSKIGFENNSKFLGGVFECLVVDKGVKQGLEGRLINYKPVYFQGCEELIGKFVKVKIREARSYVLKGDLAGSC